MGSGDKMQHKAQETPGQSKETVGDVTYDKDLQAGTEGQPDGVNIKQDGENVRAAFR